MKICRFCNKIGDDSSTEDWEMQFLHDENETSTIEMQACDECKDMKPEEVWKIADTLGLTGK